jgi:hypothetical protein
VDLAAAVVDLVAVDLAAVAASNPAVLIPSEFRGFGSIEGSLHDRCLGG